MKTRASLLLALVAGLLAQAAFAADEQAKIYLDAADSEAIASREGKAVIVYGVVSGSLKSPSGTNFVHFGDSDFYLVTFKSDLDPFTKGEPHQAYEGKRLAIEGTISIYQNKPQIKLTSPEQVTVLAEDAVYPPVAAPQAKAPTEAASPENPATPAVETPAAPEKPKPPVDPSEYFR